MRIAARLLVMLLVVNIAISVCLAAGKREKVSREKFGKEWPLTVDAGEIECIDGFIVVFHRKEKTYALNGAAKSRGYQEIDPIWRDNPKIKGAKINIGPLTNAALKLCN